MKKIIAAVCDASVIMAKPAPVAASDAWGVAAQALGVFAAYKSALVEMIKIGNNAALQTISKEQDLTVNGIDKTANDTAQKA